ncbi:ABC transporter substrate-binding protein [Microbacterium hatanonis]|jgi:ABC-type nitrate/sulfonate/bicarbonate transport system substrate-binding protein|uniref:Thiamine pyrimidine synthase n=1 Tax=Microbacterium hatanonis TaxID=404366 RepID=A0A5C8I398_9MICO|nr:ABC transporter substrate-binding protein [Microbacterium hatanonis]TXK12809.1 ABC transporter substrate-binding protein [Microbacterium hatanonis]
MTARRTAAGLLGALTLIATTALAGCSTPAGDTGSSPSADESLGSITMQLPWILNSQFIGEYLAIDEGYFTDAGLEGVNLVPGPSSSVSEVLSGTVDVGMVDAMTLGATVANENAPIKIIASGYQKNPYSILSLADGDPIEEPQDLIGKKIGVQDVNVILFDALLAANGIDKTQVEIVPVSYDPSPLIFGEIDGYMSFLTNESILVRAEGHDAVDMPFADNGLPFVADAIIATDEMIANEPEKLKAFLEGEIRGYAEALRNPQKGIDLMMSQSGTDLGLDPANELLCAEAANTQLVVTDETAENGLFTTSETLQAETVTTLATAGITVTADQLFDMSLLEAVYAEHPELIDYAAS